MSSYDAIVLGLGGMGSAAAWELARRGARVLGLEQYALGHDRGSSHGHTRVIRKAYFEDPAYVPLLRRAYELWYELEQLSGEHLFTECGCLSLGPPDGTLIAGVRRAAREHGLPVEELTAAGVRRRFPAFRPPDGAAGVLEADAGFLYVERSVEAFQNEAMLSGAELRAGEPVLRWEATPAEVRVHTARGSYAAGRLVVTGGAWAGHLLAELGLPLRVLRKVLFWFQPAEAAAFRRDRFPVYLAETPGGTFYGFPAVDRQGHKVARHDGGEEVAPPEAVERTVGPGEATECAEFLRGWLPGAAGPRTQARVCLYTMTPDSHFAVGVHPAHSRVVLAAGFSGHGFKFAPVMGEVLADLAESGRTRWPIGLFGLERWPRPARGGGGPGR